MNNLIATTLYYILYGTMVHGQYYNILKGANNNNSKKKCYTLMIIS